jgi:hypothetical protein
VISIYCGSLILFFYYHFCVPIPHFHRQYLPIYELGEKFQSYHCRVLSPNLLVLIPTSDKVFVFELCGIVYDNLVTGVFARKQGDGLYMVGLRHWATIFPIWKFVIPRLKIEYTLSIMTD